jgi:hypothetical protein
MIRQGISDRTGKKDSVDTNAPDMRSESVFLQMGSFWPLVTTTEK